MRRLLSFIASIALLAQPAFASGFTNITGGGTGTVTTVGVTTANGVSGSVANPTTTPAITVTLGAITPSSVAASGTVTGSNLSGTNTGNQTITLTSDVTGSGTGSFATTVKSLPLYASGRYYVPDGIFTLGVGTANVVGTTYLVPGNLHHAVTIQSLVTRITTLGAGNCQYALYAADATTGDPTGAPFYTSASTSTGTAALLEIATTQSLGPGLVWFGLQVDNTTVVFETNANSGAGMLNISGEVTAATFLSGGVIALSKTGTFGTWPTLTGNRTTDSLGESTSKGVAWGFKVQ